MDDISNITNDIINEDYAFYLNNEKYYLVKDKKSTYYFWESNFDVILFRQGMICLTNPILKAELLLKYG